MTSTTSPTERVGRYQLLEPIGIGPSGSVSRAKVFGVAGFERQFAVKRFHPELTSTAAMAAMLSAAARAYGSLEHPRIARMSEFGVAQGATFTAVEYVLGLDALRLVGEARLAGVTLAAGGALALVSQAARAVGYAHGRGLTHLGLAPTNVIVTAEGDIKITDFGILSATLPQRPIEVSRLTQRIPYLAPEQLANEATSAATDVFALGVLAYELITGSRTFKGDTPQQVASAIMAGPPAEPPLPRPIVRVLQRCLARSPFERFPDARALADALDAALRVAPVPGTRKDIGAQVKETLDRLAALNDGQMSGMVALHLGTGPIRRLTDDDVREAGGAPAQDQAAMLSYELSRPDLGGVGPAFGPSSTMPDLPRPPIVTMPGVAPPPIPVPPGLVPPGAPPGPPGPGSHTLMGMGKPPPAIPPIKLRTGSPSTVTAKPPAVPPAALRTGSRTEAPLPGEAAPLRTQESAIHTLDPSDVVQLDDAISDPDDLDAGLEAGTVFGLDLGTGTGLGLDGGTGTDLGLDAGTVLGSSAGLEPDLDDRAPTSSPFSDDFLDAPTHAINSTRSGNPSDVPARPSPAPNVISSAPPPGAKPAAARSASPTPSAASSGSRPNAAPAAASSGSRPNAVPTAAASSGSRPNAASSSGSQPVSAGSKSTAAPSAGSRPNAVAAGSGSGPNAAASSGSGPNAASSGSGPNAAGSSGSRPNAVAATGAPGSGPNAASASGARPMPAEPDATAASAFLVSPALGLAPPSSPSLFDPLPGTDPATTLLIPATDRAVTANFPPDAALIALASQTSEMTAEPRPSAPTEPRSSAPIEPRSSTPSATTPSSAPPPAAPPAPLDDIDLLPAAAERLSSQTILGFAAPLPLPRTTAPPPAPSPVVVVPPASSWQRPLGETQPEDIQAPPDEPPAPKPAPTAASPASPAAAAPPAQPPGWITAPPPRSPSPITPLGVPRKRGGGLVIGVVLAAAVGVGAWQIYERTHGPDAGSAKVAVAPSDARSSDASKPAASDAAAAVVAAIDAATPNATADAGKPVDAGKLADAGKLVDAAPDAAKPIDAGKVADAATPDAGKPAPIDAGKSAPIDAGVPRDAAPASTPSGAGDTLAIASTPAGAHVFLDGADTGTTPVKLPGSPDRHTIALMLAGHELYVAQVDGHGTFQIPLKEVTPTNGPAGIKVMRCKPDRYYVFVDGKPSGQACPTERIGCEVGAHTVEVYDVVSETRRKWDIVVKDTRLSFRVRVE